jgi:hypothetical protein
MWLIFRQKQRKVNVSEKWALRRIPETFETPGVDVRVILRSMLK